MDDLRNSKLFRQKIQNIKKSKAKKDLCDEQLLSNELLINKKEKNSENSTKGKIIKDSSSQYSLLLSGEVKSLERKKRKIKETEKLFIVDDINNIFVQLKEPKLRLHIQEILYYFIAFLISVYYWIFLFLTGIKFERNYYLTDSGQFETTSDDVHMCDFPENSANIIIYNKSLNYNHFYSDEKEFFEEEYNSVSNYYKEFLIRASDLYNKNGKATVNQALYIIDKPLFSVIIINKENWVLYYRYFSMCEKENYFFIMVMILGIGGIIGSFLFGFLSDIYGRKKIIIITLIISTIATFGIFILSLIMDKYYENQLHFFQEKCLSIKVICSHEIIPELYAQNKTKEKFKNMFIYYLLCIFLLSLSFWPLSKLCMVLLVENTKSEIYVLINFRRYNFFFQGLPPLVASLIFVALNNLTLTFLILGILNFITLISSFVFLDESMRYYYEYCEWENLTKVLLNNYKIKLSEFRTLNEQELKEYQQKEKFKSFNKVNLSMYKSFKHQSNYIIEQTYFQNNKNAFSSLKRNIKRNMDFSIKLDDVKSYPLLIFSSLLANHNFQDSIYLILIILILLYIILDLLRKEFLEPPFFSTKDLYIGLQFNYIINSVLFYYLIINFASNYFYYFFSLINCFKKVIYVSQITITFGLIIYYLIINNVPKTPMDFSQYDFNMITIFSRDIRSKLVLILLFLVYFTLNGVIIYVYLLLIKISKTFHRSTAFSLHSIALIIANIISELIYYYSEQYFLFLGILNCLCIINFWFLDEFKESIYLVNDLKVNTFGIRNNNWREKFKAI